jgi:pimeloyl-ACP methyl ester carboxylesterase
MGFVEFDDQGVLWSRQQMWTVQNQLIDMSEGRDLLTVVFVHGWKHNADAHDGNIATFRTVLADLAAAEERLSQQTGVPARQVAGIYLGWRGATVPIPWIENLTCWDRTSTAQKVGYAGVIELLSRLEQIRRVKDGMAPSGTSRTRLVVVGHSFGGAVVATALSQLLGNRFVDTNATNAQGDVAGFGNLVVLINPAFEGVLLSPLSDMATERGTYFRSQLPVLAILTSEADYATRYAFPAGRRFSTLFQKERNMTRWNATTKQTETIDEEDANVTAVGHFQPYRTHWLYPSDTRRRSEIAQLAPDEAVHAFLRSSDAWADDVPGSKIPFDGLVLERTPTSAGRNPYLVIYVDRRLIRDHNDISDPRVVDFVKQLILLSTHTADEAAYMRRAMGMP